MPNKIEKTEPESEALAIERVLISGDLGKLTPDQRLSYYSSVCESVGLNKLTNPFAYIKLNGKLVLYALKGCTDQLRAVHKISIQIVRREVINDIYTVTARATCNGRTDEDEGSVSIKGLHGDAAANSRMKALTKAKRRVTLSLVGLGMLDETEAETIPGAVMTPAAFAAHPDGKGDNDAYERPDGEGGSHQVDIILRVEPGLLAKWKGTIEGKETASEVRDALQDAEGLLDAEEFQELQLIADDHLEFLGDGK